MELNFHSSNRSFPRERQIRHFLFFQRFFLAEAHSPPRRDIAMLEACDYAYATSGCSQLVRQFAKKGGCHVLKQYRQAALLEAIHHRLRSDRVGLALRDSNFWQV